MNKTKKTWIRILSAVLHMDRSIDDANLQDGSMCTDRAYIPKCNLDGGIYGDCFI